MLKKLIKKRNALVAEMEGLVNKAVEEVRAVSEEEDKRIKEIEDHCGETLVSEGIASNYMDIINYALFGIIRIDEQANQAASKGE